MYIGLHQQDRKDNHLYCLESAMIILQKNYGLADSKLFSSPNSKDTSILGIVVASVLLSPTSSHSRVRTETNMTLPEKLVLAGTQPKVGCARAECKVITLPNVMGQNGTEKGATSVQEV